MREPTEAARIEYALANFASNYFNFNSSRGSIRVKLSDFLLFSDVWSRSVTERLQDERYSDLDREIFSQLQ